jgi:hypothetical protein
MIYLFCYIRFDTRGAGIEFVVVLLRLFRHLRPPRGN